MTNAISFYEALNQVVSVDNRLHSYIAAAIVYAGCINLAECKSIDVALN